MSPRRVQPGPYAPLRERGIIRANFQRYATLEMARGYVEAIDAPRRLFRILLSPFGEYCVIEHDDAERLLLEAACWAAAE